MRGAISGLEKGDELYLAWRSEFYKDEKRKEGSIKIIRGGKEAGRKVTGRKEAGSKEAERKEGRKDGEELYLVWVPE